MELAATTDEPVFVPDVYMNSQTPHTCPVCDGMGNVLTRFYSGFGPYAGTALTGTGNVLTRFYSGFGPYAGTALMRETCRACGGSGVLWR